MRSADARWSRGRRRGAGTPGRARREASCTEGVASRHNKVQLHFNKGIAGAPAEAVAATKNTATNPAVVDAFVLVIIASGERAAYPGMSRQVDVARARRRKLDVDRAVAELRKIAPDAGSYVSESNYFHPAWQAAYWGTNYPKLRAIKRNMIPRDCSSSTTASAARSGRAMASSA